MNDFEVQKEQRRVEKILREPVFCELPAATQRIRTYLFLVASIGLVVGLYDLRIGPESSILGLRFDGLSDALIRNLLVTVIVYLLAHFVWAAWDSLLEWFLRLTGARTAYVTTAMYASEEADYPADPRQSTLANWWSERTSAIGRIDEKLDTITKGIEDIKSAVANVPDNDERTVLGNIKGMVEDLGHRHRELRDSVKSTNDTLNSSRLTVSLRRFERWHQYFIRSQNLRWLIFDFGLPVLIAAFAILVLANAP